VVDVISLHCNGASQFEDLRAIGQALQSGDNLQVDILTGGWTNFSYRVFLERNPELQLYAKLSFPRALWNPDPSVHYDVERTTNEFKMMEVFHMIDPGSVAVPYLCLDVDDMKLLVTQWAEADEQWANQFIDGSVDRRIVPKLATALAKLHCLDFDPDFNTSVRDCVQTIFPVMTERTRFLYNPEIEPNRVSKFVRELGQETCDLIFENCMKSLDARECLIHSDSHVFNILVEKKPNVSALEQFGPEGKYALCDWEMSMAGPLGRDIGLTMCFPIACIIAHAYNGHKEVADSILDVLDLLWSEYALALKAEGQKDEECLRAAYRCCIGWSGYFLYVINYLLGIQVAFLPLEENVGDIEKVKESLGYLGLQLMRMGFGEDDDAASLAVLRTMFRSTVTMEVGHQLASKRPRYNRRTSILRASGRRVSDANLLAFSASCKHISQVQLEAFLDEE